MKYLRCCGNCARCAQCYYSHAGVPCRNYKPSGKEITVNVVYDVPEAASYDAVDLTDYVRSLAPDPAPMTEPDYVPGFRVLSFWGQNANAFYDPEKAYNGGGYWQPSGGCLVDVNGVDVVVEYDKFDCGDFGCRRSYTVDAPGFRWSWRESNMDGDGGAYYVPYDSISGVLGVDAEEMLDAVREAVQLASSLGWHDDDPESFSDEEDAV